MKICTFMQGADCKIQPHFSEVQEHEFYIPTAEVKGITGGAFLPETIKDATALYLDDNLEKGFEVDDISSMFHYGLKSCRGGLDSNTHADVKYELKCGVFDRILHDDGVFNLQPSTNITNECEDWFVDVDLTKKVPELDYGFCEDSGTEASSESHFPEASNEAVEQRGSDIPGSDCQPDQFDIITLSHGPSDTGYILPVEYEIHQQSSVYMSDVGEMGPDSNAGSVESDYRDGKNIFSFRNPEQMLYVPRNTEYGGIASPECGEDKDVFMSNYTGQRNVAPLLVQKRSRKPPQRYIEEWLDFRSQNFKGSKQRSASSKKGKHLGFMSQSNHWHEASKMALVVSRSSSPGRSPRPVPFLDHKEFSMRSVPKKGYPGKHEDFSMRCSRQKEFQVQHPTKSEATMTADFESDDEYVPVYSNSKKRISEKASDRRKRNKLWSLPEVVKLVDGISQFGVGKWTAIKKTYFSSSSYRTSLDIRDKWRNLLKTTRAQLKDDTEDEGCRRNCSQLLPKSLLQRVSELASVYPYPRQGKVQSFHRTSKRDYHLPWPE